MEKQEIEKFNKIFSWYQGLSSDLLFWVAIDTLFLTVVKGFSASQIVSLTTISVISYIVLQDLILKIINKIGNTKSVRLSSLLLLIVSLLYTFGTKYITIAIGKIIYEISWSFHNMANIMLKNNLELQKREAEYIKIQNKSNTIYAVITMIISFIAGPMFNLNNYLPMIPCIIFCLICLILSFSIRDFSKYDRIKENKKSNAKIKYNKLIIVLIISFGIFYPLINSGQHEGKLFIQQELLMNFNTEKTTLIISAILCISRIIRVISNIIFNKLYTKYKDKVGIILAIMLLISFVLMISGYLIKDSIILKFTIMSCGYMIILFIRDPFRVSMQDLALRSTKKESQKTLLTIMELSNKIVRFIMSLSFTMILVDNPMIIVISILFILSIIEILISIKLYKIVISFKERNDEESSNRDSEQAL